MLVKLLKYEMKASARTLIPLYIGTLVVALVCSLMLTSIREEGFWFTGFIVHSEAIGSTGGLVFTFACLLFFGLCVAITVLTIMTVIQRFNHSLIGDEGYLMFTLPVTYTQLLSSKLAGALLWSIIGFVVMVLSLVIISFSGVMLGWETFNWPGVWDELGELFSNAIMPMLTSGIYGLFSLAGTILTVYLSIMIAQTEKLNNHRVTAAVILFFVIGWLFDGVASILFGSMAYIAVPDGFHISQDFMWLYNVGMACRIAYEAVKCVICFIGTKWLMQNKLNL